MNGEAMHDDDDKGDGPEETQLTLLREIRDLQAEMVAGQKMHQWILLPIFTLLTIMLILGLSGLL